MLVNKQDSKMFFDRRSDIEFDLVFIIINSLKISPRDWDLRCDYLLNEKLDICLTIPKLNFLEYSTGPIDSIGEKWQQFKLSKRSKREITKAITKFRNKMYRDQLSKIDIVSNKFIKQNI